MKKMKQVVMKLALFASIFTTIGVFAHKAMADDTPETVTFTLHKLAFDNTMPEQKQNDGETNPFQDTSTPLSGVQFKMYDVTEEYTALVTGEKAISPEDAVNSIRGTYTRGIPSEKKEFKTLDYTKADGTTTIDQVPAKKLVNGKMKDAVYIFVETDSPTTVKNGSSAIPMVVTMPVYKSGSNEKLTSIHLYPKNVVKSSFSKTKNEKDTQAYDMGTKFGYTLNFDIPTTAKTKVEIHDTVNIAKALSASDVVVSVSNKPLKESDYTILYNQDQYNDLFTVKFNTDIISSLVGRTVTVTYNAMITQEAPIDKAIQNIAYLVTDGHDTPLDPKKPYDPTNPNKPYFPNVPTDPTKPFNPFEPTIPVDPNNPPVFTGGYKFIKKDLNSEKALAGAEFVVTNRTKFAKFDSSNNFTAWVEEADATKITSSTDGTFEVKGLNSGDYQLKETKAPEGYALPEKTFAFTIATGTASHTYLDGEKAPAYTVNNVKKGLLPSTGAKGIYGFLAIGLLFFGAAFVFYKRANKPSEV